MAEPILVVDAGTHSTTAALVVGERAALVREPVTGATIWAAGIADRQPDRQPDRLCGLLTAMRVEALRLCADQVERLTLTVPVSYPHADRRRDAMIEAGEKAGFAEVELISDAHAAVLDAYGLTRFADGALALVCDLGDTWAATLVQIHGDTVVELGQETSTAGRDLDEMLLRDVHPGGHSRSEAIEFLRRLKHGLGEAEEIADRLDPAGAPYTLRRDWLDRLAEPGLRWIVASCRSLFARAAAGVGGHVLPPAATLTDVAAVILVGGSARLPSADWVLGAGLDRPVLRPAEPELAVLRGGVRWVAGAPGRRLMADHPKWRVEPLTWQIPGGRGRLVRWNVTEGQPYLGGSVLAQVRTPDERVFDLTAPDDGVLLAQRVGVGDPVGPTLLARAKRPASALAGDPPGKRQGLSATGEWLLTPDRQLLVECGSSAAHVKLWSIPDGHLVGGFQPELDTSHQGRVFINPGGRLSLVAWDPGGVFTVFDVLSGSRVVSFRDTNAPMTVTVNEAQWRLTVEAEDSGSAGRYRRSVATVWDLATGRRLEKLTDERRLPGYLDRSAVDGFADRAVSPDGRLHAVAVRRQDGSAAVALQEATSDHELFRAEHGHSVRVRTAFSADGQFLLANWESDRHSEVDVWEL